MKNALILSAALFALGAGMPAAQAAGPMSPSGLSPLANSNGTINLHDVARPPRLPPLVRHQGLGVQEASRLPVGLHLALSRFQTFKPPPVETPAAFAFSGSFRLVVSKTAVKAF